MDAVLTEDIQTLRIVTAWAKRSGLARIADRVDSFRSNGGTVEIILGVSEGGATQEGLELALELADAAYVFHDPRRTFHPKVYYASGPSRRELVVGSSNLTAGGIGWNFEASLWASADAVEDAPIFDDVDEWIELLRAQSAACKTLDEQLLANLAASSDIAITTEGAARRTAKKNTDTPEDSDSVNSTSVTGLFGIPDVRLRPLRTVAGKVKSATATQSVALDTTGVSPATTLGVPPMPTDTVLRRWFRDLDHTAAQQKKGANSNTTGNLRLSQADLPIDQKVYFRRDFFGGLPWAPTPGKKTESELVVNFDCHLGQEHLGDIDVRVSHDLQRVSGQGNVPTVLHWGPELGKLLRGNNLIGKYVTLERLSDDTFRLSFSDAPLGDFLA